MKAASIAAGILLSGMVGSADAGESLLVTMSSASSVIAAYTLVVPTAEVASGLIARAVLPMGLS